ncbi:MAG: AmmeMemoRadiSam system radical SAM enzyme, partial [Bacteroidota bacterium]|nr:AmmeMemoRadiSam system radical SAM enzyme [Bacteroidota bacterium]
MQNEALYYKKLSNHKVECMLCPHHCRLSNDQRGICKVRINIEGVLYTEVFGKVASLAIDPIEKKPLFHFYPGRQILSFGTNGCNLRCSFCQNYTISQHSGENAYYTRKMKPADIVELATRHKD